MTVLLANNVVSSCSLGLGIKVSIKRVPSSDVLLHAKQILCSNYRMKGL